MNPHRCRLPELRVLYVSFTLTSPLVAVPANNNPALETTLSGRSSESCDAPVHKGVHLPQARRTKLLRPRPRTMDMPVKGTNSQELNKGAILQARD